MNETLLEILAEIDLKVIQEYMATRKAHQAEKLRASIHKLEQELRDLGEVETPRGDLPRRVRAARVNSGNSKIREALTSGGITLEEANELGGFTNRASVYSALFRVGAKRRDDGRYWLEATT